MRWFRRRCTMLLVALLLLAQLPFPATRVAVATAPFDQALAGDAVPGQLLVVFRPTANETERDAAVARRGARTVQELDSINARLIEVPPARTATAVAEIAAEPTVSYIQPNYIYTLDQTPDDSNFDQLWGLDNTGQSDGTVDADIDAPEAWGGSTGNQSIVVGVVDTGILYTHPDLAANMWTAPPGWDVKGCGEGTRGYRNSPGDPADGSLACDPIDEQSHGTHVAGTIGAVGDNGQGVTGVNWSVQLMALRFFNKNAQGTTAGAIDVIDYAIQAKQAGVNLRVLNNSWTGSVFDPALLAQIDRANDNGILFVAAAGNGGADSIGDDNDKAAIYPASYGAPPYNRPNVISVTATSRNDLLGTFSNYGATTVHLGAPGVRILSTVLNDTYGTKDGTSMAAPLVSGAAALLLSVASFDSLAPAELRERLLDCGDPVAALSGKTISGKRLNVANAISGAGGCADPPTPAPLPGLAAVWPLSGAAGDGLLALTVRGADFVPNSVVRWNGTDRGTTYISNTELVATILPADFAAIGSATVVVANPAPGGGESETLQFTIARGEQTIAFGPLHDKVFGRSPFALSATATSGLTVSFAAAGDCTVDGATVTLTAVGDCTITASQAGDANFFPASDVVADFAILPPPSPSPSPSPSQSLVSFSLVQASGGTAAANPGSGQFPVGTEITLTALANFDQLFTGWLVDGTLRSYANPARLILSGNRVAMPTFATRPSFGDVPQAGASPGHISSYEAITQLAARGVIRGYAPSGCAARGITAPCFGPNDQITRAEMAALIARAMGWEQENWGNPFTDSGGIDPNLWRNVGTLAHYGVAFGYGNGTFGPNDKVTYAQTLSFITRAMAVKGFWQARTVPPDPVPYGGVLNGTGHQNDVATFLYYTSVQTNYGGVPDHAASGDFPDWNLPSSRGWFSRALWAALLSQYGGDTLP